MKLPCLLVLLSHIIALTSTALFPSRLVSLSLSLSLHRYSIARMAGEPEPEHEPDHERDVGLAGSGSADAECPSCSRSLAGVVASVGELVCPECGTGVLMLSSESQPELEHEEEPEDDLPPSDFTFAIFDRSTSDYVDDPEWPVFFIGSPDVPELTGADRVEIYPWMDGRRFRWLECLEGSHFQFCNVRRGKKMSDPVSAEEQREAYVELRRRLLELGLKEAPEEMIRAQEEETGYTAVRANTPQSTKASAESGKPTKARGRLAEKSNDGPARKKRGTATADEDLEAEEDAPAMEEAATAVASSAAAASTASSGEKQADDKK